MLTPEELEQCLPAEQHAFRSPIPTQSVSSDEFLPGPQTEKQREFEGRLKQYGSELARKHGVTRRRFFQSTAGMAAAFMAMNDTYGPLFGVSRAEAQTPGAADERAKKLKGQFVMDMHTHFLREGTPVKVFIGQRETVGKAGWNPMLQGKPQTIEDLMFPNYFKEIFLDSDTKVTCISGSYSHDEPWSFLTNDMKRDAREKINKEAGTKRMFSHAIFTPGWDGWMERVDYAIEVLKADSFKAYTIGDNTNKHLSKHPFRLDDEKLLYPFYEKVLKASKNSPGLVNICIHKGLFPPVIEKKFPHLLFSAKVDDVGKAAKDWPQLNFVIYHSAFRYVAPAVPEQGWEQFEKTGRVDWVTDLAEIPEKYDVKNVYADLGQIFAQSIMSYPQLCAAMMGQMVKGLGADHVCWGTDAIWTGGPQWQIEALRRLEIPEDMQKKYGFKPLGPADGPVKTAILGGNNARIYKFTPQQRAALENDRFAQAKAIYDKHGGDRSNLYYGYIRKPAA